MGASENKPEYSRSIQSISDEYENISTDLKTVVNLMASVDTNRSLDPVLMVQVSELLERLLFRADGQFVTLYVEAGR